MSSYEKELQDLNSEKKEIPGRVHIPILRYLWMSSPLSSHKRGAIPNFLRNIGVLKNFTDNELRILSKHLHQRSFSANEYIFNEGDSGFGFFFILQGTVEVYIKGKSASNASVVLLQEGDYFGELALLEENSKRSASAVTRDDVTLLGIFKPDLDDLIESYPVVAAKLLQSISIIIANRLSLVTNEMKILKNKITVHDQDGAALD
ncbi:MAG: cyclic nucleotide-binding domain-containing protein [Bacteriovoracaceae bacterium]|nr:cyclic nucleotide-binding domain-containing protein [Bacteriovoracaceae bacterium]